MRNVSWWVLAVGGAVLAGAGLAVLSTRAEVLRHSHPSSAVATLGAVAVGLLVLVLSLWRRGRAGPGVRARRGSHRTSAHPRLGAVVRVLLGALAVLLAVGLLALRPLPATAAARAALTGDDRVRVQQRWGTVTLLPSQPRPDAPGLVFTAGARVDPRAYAPLLRPLAEAGHVVVVLPPPLGIALTDPDQSQQAVRAHPEVPSWFAGGHSLGGVSASLWAGEHAGREARGLLLWASYPTDDLSGAPLRACSVSGGRDGLTTPADVDRSRTRLPPGTLFTEVPGAVHAYFGDYGPQSGDGVPTVSRAEARAQIVAASLECLGSAG